MLCDAAKVFSNILSKQKGFTLSDDRQWADRLRLCDTDLSDKSLRELARFWQSHEKNFGHRRSDQSLVGVKWLKLVSANRKVIEELFQKFSDNAQFEKHMQIFGDNDPVQQQRSMSLLKVRNTIVDFLKACCVRSKRFFTMTDLVRELSELVDKKLERDDVRVMEVVTASWKQVSLTAGCKILIFCQSVNLYDNLTAL